MKHSIFITSWLCLAFASFGQPVNTEDSYLKKSKNLRTAAVVIGSSGIILAAGGAVLWATEGTVVGPSNGADKAGTVMMATGGGLMITSIALFILSDRNKKKAKAASVSFQPQKTLQLQRHSLVSKSIPSVSLKIRL